MVTNFIGMGTLFNKFFSEYKKGIVIKCDITESLI